MRRCKIAKAWESLSVLKPLGLLLPLVALWALPKPVAAAEFHVRTSAEFQTALNDSANNGEDDTIYLAAGTYEGNFSCRPQDGKSLVIKGESETTAEDIILDGGGTGSVLRLQGSIVGSVKVEGLAIQNGKTSSHGGGIYLQTWEDAELSMEIWNSIIRYNQAGKRGGGIKADSHGGNSRIDLLIVNTLIYGNQANWSGGGIDVTASEVGDNNVTRATIINSTISDNVADVEDAGYEKGGGIRVYAYQGNGAVASLDLYNTIVRGNSLGSGESQDLYVGKSGPGHAEVAAYHCDIGSVDGDPGLYSPVNVIDADPAFFDPENGDFHLRAGSACIDAGTTAIPDPPGLPAADFEGDPRIVGVAPDIGADEFRQPIYLPLVAKNST